MKKLLFILFILALPALALPAFSFAEPEVVVVPDAGPSFKAGSDATPRSWRANDIFHVLAHTCNVPTTTCGPDNIVTNPFGARVRVFLPTSQIYTIYSIFVDIEGNTRLLAPAIFNLSSGFQTITVSGVVLPGFSSVATAGLYRFLSLVVGSDGTIAFSDYYRFRVDQS